MPSLVKKLACILVSSLALVACGSGGPAPERPTSSEASESATPAPPPPPPPVLPLSGEEGERANPALVVKVENSRPSRPQTGLEQADLVFEELVEGGETRFAAVFHSEIPETVGPVRSIRPMDPAIAAPFGGRFAYSGGIPEFVDALRAVPSLVDVGQPTAPEGYFRSDERRSPHNLYLRPAALPEGRPDLPQPQPFASFGEVTGPPATRVDLQFSPTSQVSFALDPASGRYVRSQAGEPFLTAAGPALSFDNVLVLSVEIRETPFRDAAGNPVPETVLAASSGNLVLLSKGVRVDGTWSKESRDAPFVFKAADGSPLVLAPGSTAVELFPSTAVPAVS